MPRDSRVGLLVRENLVLELLIVFLRFFRGLDEFGREGLDEPDLEDVSFFVGDGEDSSSSSLEGSASVFSTIS